MLTIFFISLFLTGHPELAHASWFTPRSGFLGSSSRKLLQVIPSVSCGNQTTYTGCVAGGSVEVGPLGAGFEGRAAVINPNPFVQGGAFVGGEVYGTYTDDQGE
eukprot:jgi/Botrbrau1/20430/Bobra.0405s0001.1